ncbi:MAG TPA: hypothetical protein PKL56_01885 [Cyclobacteriaceae bacterium]|nr:hypothetical protein [Cyclobacteriaceae bacterium]HMV10951.1 hypothetical protein [Cyclobacteriaceae bacterium]HMV89135.1 hypothetical protein [Cyclobacteriaceae bacterium]HMX00030.1 hypothetical protein [Cyclobacteriaceae bacterium]HMY92850.1 hypothetical protein [Cyclobacteriaceae bacterium]
MSTSFFCAVNFMLSVYILLIPLFGFILIDRIRKLIAAIKDRNYEDVGIDTIFLALILIICVLLIVLIVNVKN